METILKTSKSLHEYLVNWQNYVEKNNNFKHIILNNNSHESVGEQITNAQKINFKSICHGLGYKKYLIIKNEKDLVKKIIQFRGMMMTYPKLKNQY